MQKLAKIQKKFRKPAKNAHFLDTFIVGACLKSRKYMSRILCWGSVKIGLVSRQCDKELVEILDIVKW